MERRLKQAIVIVNQFGKRKTRTPERYIRNYTSRLDASEALTPYTDPHDLAFYMQDYMARKEASDDVIFRVQSNRRLVEVDERITPQSARVFGNRGLVYREKDFNEAIRVTEKANQEDHTLILPVISFDFDFLQSMGVIPKSVSKAKNKGDYMGQVDQLKLRKAISRAMETLTKKMHFVSPEWTGAIQLDTKNVHCHLTLVETAPEVPEARIVKAPRKVFHEEEGKIQVEYERDDKGQIVYDRLGERGKISSANQAHFRRALEQELFYMKDLNPFVNRTSPQKQLVKDKAVQLILSKSQLSNQLVQIY